MHQLVSRKGILTVTSLSLFAFAITTFALTTALGCQTSRDPETYKGICNVSQDTEYLCHIPRQMVSAAEARPIDESLQGFRVDVVGVCNGLGSLYTRG